jgi:hypothetical protein
VGPEVVGLEVPAEYHLLPDAISRHIATTTSERADERLQVNVEQ